MTKVTLTFFPELLKIPESNDNGSHRYSMCLHAASVALEGGRGTVPTSGWFGRGACS